MILNVDIKNILLAKQISHLYHVNSVATALTFLNNGGLLSRGTVEDLGLNQTAQESDEKDKELGVNYDIFFDSVDIHQRAKKINDYGPITFIYSIDFIDSLPEGTIKITKDNPWHWTAKMSESDKYFIHREGLLLNYRKGIFSQHLTIIDQHQALPFDSLEQIVIDDPNIENRTYFDQAFFTLNEAIEKNGVNVPLVRRICPPDCGCLAQYR